MHPFAPGPLRPTTTVLLGGIRSGKSVVAEGLVDESAALTNSRVTYVARVPNSTTPAGRNASRCTSDDGRRRGARSSRPPPAVGSRRPERPGHRRRTRHVAHRQAGHPGAWDVPRAGWEPATQNRVTALAREVEHYQHHLVLVSDEAGLTLVPDNRAGRIFLGRLGLTNQRVAAAGDAVLLVVAGQVLPVKQP